MPCVWLAASIIIHAILIGCFFLEQHDWSVGLCQCCDTAMTALAPCVPCFMHLIKIIKKHTLPRPKCDFLDFLLAAFLSQLCLCHELFRALKIIQSFFNSYQKNVLNCEMNKEHSYVVWLNYKCIELCDFVAYILTLVCIIPCLCSRRLRMILSTSNWRKKEQNYKFSES